MDDTISFAPVSRAPSPDLFDPWILLPEPMSQGVPPAQRMVTEIQRMTGWSDRRLAEVLHSTHPTVRAVARGASSARRGDLHGRISDAYGVIQRIFLVARQNPHEADRLLTTSPSEGSPDAASLLAHRDAAGAYLVALAVSRPQRTPGLIRGMWPSGVGDATADLAAD